MFKVRTIADDVVKVGATWRGLVRSWLFNARFRKPRDSLNRFHAIQETVIQKPNDSGTGFTPTGKDKTQNRLYFEG